MINGMMYITYVLGCHVIGIDYRGKSNQTIERIPCQPWSSLTPHWHSFNDAQYHLEDTMEEAGSFCRSPRHPHSTHEYWVWCYTTDPSTRWGYCNMADYCGDYSIVIYLNSLRPRQNGRFFADDTFKRIFLNENIRISTKNSLKFVPKGLINNIPALVLMMAWRRPGDKPLSEPMMVRSLTHICVTRPQWVNGKTYAK